MPLLIKDNIPYEAYVFWMHHADDATVAELKEIRTNEDEIFERFYKEVEFGTGGMRGVIGAGYNRIKPWQ